MRCFLICTIDTFYPIEEIASEGGLAQSIETHIELHNEIHRSYIRVFFPEMPTETLTARDRFYLEYQIEGGDIAQQQLARTIRDLYDNTIR